MYVLWRVRSCHQGPGGLSSWLFTTEGIILHIDMHIRARQKIPKLCCVLETNIINRMEVWTKVSNVSQEPGKPFCFSDFWKGWHKWLHSYCWLWDSLVTKTRLASSTRSSRCSFPHAGITGRLDHIQRGLLQAWQYASKQHSLVILPINHLVFVLIIPHCQGQDEICPSWSHLIPHCVCVVVGGGCMNN